jgi:hypothetical protein
MAFFQAALKPGIRKPSSDRNLSPSCIAGGVAAATGDL